MSRGMLIYGPGNKFQHKDKIANSLLVLKGPNRNFCYCAIGDEFLRTKYIPSYTSLVSDGKIKYTLYSIGPSMSKNS